MRAVLQRCTYGAVAIEGKTVGKINRGFVLLLGIQNGDTEAKCDYLLDKVLRLRVFEDEAGKLNRSLLDIGGELLVVSQFTLYADCRKGRRPSFLAAARPEQAIPLYKRFLAKGREQGVSVQSGVFGADMMVSIENDGPVTILLDTEELMEGKE